MCEPELNCVVYVDGDSDHCGFVKEYAFVWNDSSKVVRIETTHKMCNALHFHDEKMLCAVIDFIRDNGLSSRTFNW